LGVAVAAFIGLYTLGVVAAAVWMWQFKAAYEDYVDGRISDVEFASQVGPAVGLSVVGGIMFVAAIVVTIVWLWRVRVNAGVINPAAPHRWGRDAAVWGWLPVVNFWVPRRLVLDVVAAGVPGVSAALVNWWWGTWLASLLLERLTRIYTDPDSRYFDIAQAGMWTTAGAVLTVAAAVFFLRIVRRITAWQSGVTTYQPGEEALPPFV
jgi:hypothetical protein